jgi:hypothetical protein
MGINISEMIEKQIVHMILSQEELNDDVYDKDFVLKVLKKMACSKLKGYKGNMVRTRGKLAHQYYLQKYYPIEKYPEKHI